MSTYNKTNNIFFTQSVQHIAKDCCVVKNFFEHVAATLGQCFKQSSTMKIWGVCKRSASCETKIRHTGNDIVDYKVYTCQDKKKYTSRKVHAPIELNWVGHLAWKAIFCSYCSIEIIGKLKFRSMRCCNHCYFKRKILAFQHALCKILWVLFVSSKVVDKCRLCFLFTRTWNLSQQASTKHAILRLCHAYIFIFCNGFLCFVFAPHTRAGELLVQCIVSSSSFSWAIKFFQIWTDLPSI